MGLSFRKRVNLGSGLGLNISKSGISPSIRTKAGSISSKSFSVKTGVSGVSYRKNFSTAKNSGCMMLLTILGIMVLLLIVSI
ncbi:DUF4236 domain-containing protein [Flavobacterium aquicola]|uniref:DUF4236 domain-containing protein n=1 Tax=Flavobacterium aquicola TaxID=1682742 RepID=A0A3E0DWR6_9FLAO|nr:DUF4236 domain-containing protein [Flavobacterium aquicola]REG90488.1 hypothetical protein C8P67_12015 [Flavobacterium aquicola]